MRRLLGPTLIVLLLTGCGSPFAGGFGDGAPPPTPLSVPIAGVLATPLATATRGTPGASATATRGTPDARVRHTRCRVEHGGGQEHPWHADPGSPRPADCVRHTGHTDPDPAWSPGHARYRGNTGASTTRRE